MQRNNLSYYDQWATEWWDNKATVAPLDKLNPLRFQFFDRYIPHWQNLNVLDIGCGGGFTCEFLAKRGASVTGIDQSAACIQAARHHARSNRLSINYKPGKAETLPFPDSTFDTVICVDVLEHVNNLEQTLSEASRVLRPNGQFCFDTINRTWQSKLIMIWLLENTLRQIPQGVHDWHKFITPLELSQTMTQHNLETQSLRGFDLFGSGILRKWQRLREYWRSGKFQIDFEQGSDRIMYIGIARKSETTPHPANTKSPTSKP